MKNLFERLERPFLRDIKIGSGNHMQTHTMMLEGILIFKSDICKVASSCQ